jgi:hypothetical protein
MITAMPPWTNPIAGRTRSQEHAQEDCTGYGPFLSGTQVPFTASLHIKKTELYQKLPKKRIVFVVKGPAKHILHGKFALLGKLKKVAPTLENYS